MHPTFRGRRLLACVLALSSCAPLSPSDEVADHELPYWLSLGHLAEEASAGLPYVARADGSTLVPMSAVVTPPGQALFFESPPFAASAATNTLAGPRLNVLPGLAEGRFTPYVTIELWRNAFGEIWTQPLYLFRDADRKQLTQASPVYGMGPTHRFYSPFWRIYWVTVTEKADLDALGTPAQPKSVKEILDKGWTIEKGGLGLCPLVPKDLTLDPVIAPREKGSQPPLPQGVWGDVLRAEYAAPGLARMVTLAVAPDAGWAEGERVTPLRYAAPGPGFRELPGGIVEGIPIFMWADRAPGGKLEPLGLPNVGGHAPVFSGRPVAEPNGFSNAATLWDVTLVVRPAGALPFFPGAAKWKALRDLVRTRVAPTAATDPLVTSAEVDALPGIDRWAGRVARRPACFAATTFPATAEGASDWAKSCGFLDSQGEVERWVSHDDFIDAGVRVLCPFVLWASEVNP